MGLLIATTDFTGKYAVAQNSFSKLDAYIERYEKNYLRDLLGVELFDLFIASIVAGLPTGVYLTLYNAIYQDDGTCIRKSTGIKDMLLGFVYFEYLRDQAFKNTVSGMHKDNTELGVNTGADYTTMTNRYNESVDNYETIQWYIDENIGDYPDYNGQPIGRVHWAL